MTSKVLVIEDSEVKWREISHLVNEALEQGLTLARAATMEEADREIAASQWDLILLDISMDIRASKSGRREGGHDTVGGLRIAERMFYLHYDAPIIIVTAFDAFPAGDDRTGTVLGLGDVLREASDLLGPLLIGCVSYGADNWEAELRNAILEAIGT